MKFPQGWVELSRNNFYVTYINSDGKVVTKGKRVSKNCLLTQEEVRTFCKEGIRACVNLIRARIPDCGLKQAMDMIHRARGVTSLSSKGKAMLSSD